TARPSASTPTTCRSTSATSPRTLTSAGSFCNSAEVGYLSRRRPGESQDPLPPAVFGRTDGGPSFASNEHSWLWVPDRRSRRTTLRVAGSLDRDDSGVLRAA